jgi:hypothetical protein
MTKFKDVLHHVHTGADHSTLKDEIEELMCIVRLVLVLHPAHHLMAPSTELRTRTYEHPFIQIGN